MKSALFVQEGY